MVYRFRVTFEENEEVFREIEIKSTQNFEDFHNSIVQSISFDNQHNASFFISDDYWRKGEEITLRNEEETDKRKRSEPKRLMNKCKMASLIDDPHQKFVYIYDPKTSWTFLIELLKIVPDDAKTSYPKCAKTLGESPKQYKTLNGLPPVPEDEDFDDDDEPHNDDEAYTNAHSDDETALLENEEGEEMAEDEEHSEDPDGGEDFDPSEFEGTSDED